MTSLQTVGKAGGTVDPPLRLIDLTIAAATRDGVTEPAGGEEHGHHPVRRPGSKGGYWYAALTMDGNSQGPGSHVPAGTPAASFHGQPSIT
jgi:hypothetical protein